MTTPSLATVAVFAAADFLRRHPGLDSPPLRAELATRIEVTLRGAVETEREACSRLCDDRARLWSSSAEREGLPGQARRDAQARANEATYLADALRVRGA